jgi:hypothetical protein
VNFLVNVPFIETVCHILNRNLPQGSEVWPPGSFDINPFDYLKCGISRRDINKSFHKKPVPDHHPSIKACSHFLFRLEEVIGTKDNFI